MVIIRRGITTISALALVAAASAASASPRPSDSLVSASRAAQTAPVVGRAGAVLDDANSITPALLLLLLVGIIGGGVALNEVLEESP